jgi:uncharacterized membrane protein
VHEALTIFSSHGRWMAWDLVLAFIPLLLAAFLFRPGRRRRVMWWVGLFIFIAFLPNAPYVISDLVHLPPDVRAAPSAKVVIFGLLPLYSAYILAGMEAYVVSMSLMRRYLRSLGRARLQIAADVLAPLAAAVGVFFGRVYRLNSWDPVLRPDKVWSAVTSLPAHAALVLAVAACIFVVGEAVWAANRLALVPCRWLASRVNAA